MTIEDVKREPTAAEIERVREAIAKDAQSLRSTTRTMARAAILAMDRRAEVVGEPVAYMGQGLLDALNKPGVEYLNCAAYTKAGLWMLDEDQRVPVYASPPAPAVAVPEGWKLVPVEPTEAMLDRGGEAVENGYFGDRVWSDMLAAAPEPPATRSEADIRNEGIEDAAKWHENAAKRLRGSTPDILIGEDHSFYEERVNSHETTATAIRALKEPRHALPAPPAVAREEE